MLFDNPCRSNKEKNEDKRDHLLPLSPTPVSSSENSSLFRIFWKKNSDLQYLILVLISFQIFGGAHAASGISRLQNQDLPDSNVERRVHVKPL